MKLICIPNEIYKSGSVLCGIVYLDCGEIQFPSKEWDDMTLAVISGWIHTMITRDIDNENFELFFLDGSYYIRFANTRLGIADMHFYGRDKRIHTICEVSIDEVRLAVYEAAKLVLSIPQSVLQNGGESAEYDYKTIKNNFERLL